MFKWISLVTGLGYIVLGVVVIVYKTFVVPIDPNTSTILGSLFILYGIFRIVRTLVRLKNESK